MKIAYLPAGRKIEIEGTTPARLKEAGIRNKKYRMKKFLEDRRPKIEIEGMTDNEYRSVD